MKIAEIVASFPPHHGGTGYICFQNAMALAGLGHDVTVFAVDYGDIKTRPDPDEITVVRLKPKLRYRDGAILPQLLPRLRGFDIFHLHYPFYGGAEFVLAASLLYQTPYLATYHMDVHGLSFIQNALINTYESMFQRAVIKRASAVAGPSREFLAQSKVSSLLNSERVADILYGGVDTGVFYPRPRPADLVEKHRLEDKTVILFVGNLQPFKGLHILMQALAKLEERHDLVLLVAGGGYGEPEYRRLSNELKIEDRVIFAGPQSQSGRLPDYYALGDFLTLPSTHSESYGLVILEAMATGLPVIVSNLPGPSQLVEAGKDGLPVAPSNDEALADAIKWMLDHPEKRKKMGAAAVEKAGRYTWQQAGKELEATLRSILPAST